MRRLAFIAALCFTCSAAVAQAPPPKKSAPARRIDDTRSRQLLDEAQGALERGDFPGAQTASLRLLEENIRTFGPDHPNVANALNLLGAAHYRMGRFGEAEGDFRRMLTLYERRLGPNHEDTAAALNSLALVLEKQGDNAGAETLLKRAVSILEKKLGREHPNTATVRPPASSAPWCASESIPRARPLTTVKPLAASSSPILCAIRRPASLAARAPTTATHFGSLGVSVPRTKMYGGGSGMWRRFTG